MTWTSRLACVFTAGVAVAACGSDRPRIIDEPVAERTALTQYESCSDLEGDLKEVLIAEMETHFEQSNGGWFPEAEDAPTSGDDSGGGGRTEGEDYSGTNNQEEGVDEADFVKTDGYHVYVLNGNRLHIFGVPEFGDLVPESVTEIEGSPREMLVNRDANRLAVFSTVHPHSLPEDHPLRELIGEETESGWYYRVPTVSKITVFDVADRENPTLVRELFLEGWYQTARMVDSSVRMGAYSWMHIPGLYDWWWYYDQDRDDIDRAKARARAKINSLTLEELVPQIYERRPSGSFIRHNLDQRSCREFYRPQNSHGRGITSILSMDLFAAEFRFDSDHIVTNWATLYASKDSLYLAESRFDWWWFWWNESFEDETNIHRFDISRPGETVYRGTGRVRGLLHDQFSMSEYQGYLRVATTTNMWARWWVDDPPVAENHVTVLDEINGRLATVGHVGGIAPNERIFAARMTGEKGYMVTFEQVDPLFTLDLTDPYEPKVIGELKVPGFSTYLHPIDDDMLLSIGVGGDDTGANWRTQVSMFDVSDFANPDVFDIEELVLEGEWGWSEAQYEHKAFQYWAPKGLLAVPLSSYDYREDGYRYASRLELLKVDAEEGLSRYGTIDHSHLFSDDQYWYYLDVRRSIFMGDFLYAISDRGVTVHDVETLDTRHEEPLPGFDPNDHYWWW